MMLRKKVYIWVLIALVMSGCRSYKEIVYLQEVPLNYQQEIVENYDIRIHPDDLLSIMVNSKDLELVQMFNLPMVSYSITGGSTGQQRVLGYLVDEDGKIDFPQLGTLNVQGMTRSELTTYIKQELINRGLVNDPIVTIQFLNFKVSVLGEVTRPGTFDMTSDRITLFDAISRAGDLTIFGKRDDVKIIREKDGRRVIGTVDLRNGDILTSPYYYLQQNDIVYVEPNRARAGQREINQNRSVGTFASLASVLISLSVLIFK